MLQQLKEETKAKLEALAPSAPSSNVVNYQYRQGVPVYSPEEIITKEIARLREGIYDEARQNEIKLPTFIIDNLLPKGLVGTLAGEPSAGKSTILVHLARCLNYGLPLASCKGADGLEDIPYCEPNEAGSVIYVCPEDTTSIVNRRKAWDLKHDPDGSLRRQSPYQFHIWKKSPQLTTEENYQALARLVDEVKPLLVIFDTLAVTLSEMGSKSDQPEHNNNLLTQLYQTAQRLSMEKNLSAIFAHHPSKGGELLRGGGAIRGSSRFVWEIRLDGEFRKILVNKANDFDSSLVSFSLKIEGQAIGENDQGKEVSMPVMTSGRITPLATGQKKLALRCLADEIEADGLAPRKDWEKRLNEAGVKGARSVMKRLVKGRLVEGIDQNAQGSFRAFRFTPLGKQELGIELEEIQGELEIPPSNGKAKNTSWKRPRGYPKGWTKEHENWLSEQPDDLSEDSPEYKEWEKRKPADYPKPEEWTGKGDC